ncbi:MAG: efflux RND transporter permease subunit [Alkalispirochaetaceae bacterium]
MNIGRFSVRNSVLINILMILILALGLFSLQRLPREQFAEIPFFFAIVTVPYPGVSAEDIEETVTVPIENEMQGLDSLDQIQSETSEGIARINIQFDQGISEEDFDTLYQDVQNRLSNVDLPDGAQQANLDEFSSTDFAPVIEVVLHGSVNYGTLDTTARNLRDRLQTIGEVSSVTLVGSRDQEIYVELDRGRMEALGVSLNEVVQALETQNVTIPAGTLRTENRDFLLRTVGELNEVEEFDQIVVRLNSDRREGVIRLGDVADISPGYDLDGSEARFNGSQAISLRIAKVPGGSSIDIVEAVRREVDRFGSNTPAGINVSYFNDSTVQLRDSLEVLTSNALYGLALLVLILLIFIGVRNAIITAVGIPITFAITFITLEAFGETLNSNTLFGLVLVLGLIVDHAIVIVENTYRLQQQGRSREEAAEAGVNQVIVPVIAATATTVAAFLPLTFLPGIIGRFLRVVPLTVSIALIASTAEAAIFLPSHYADWPGGKNLRSPGGLFDRVRHRFARLLDSLYRHRVWTVLASLLIMFLVFSQVASIPQNLFEAEDVTLFYIDIEMPPGTPIERTGEVVQAYEQRILPRVGDGEVAALNAFVGFAGGETQNVRRSNIAQIIVDLTEREEGRERSIDAIMEEVESQTRDIPGAEVVQFRKQETGPPTDPPISFRLFGDSYEELGAVSEAFQEQLSTYDGVINIDDNLDEGTPELRVRVDDTLAARYGLSAQSVGDFVRGSFDGIVAGTVFRENEESDIVVRYANRRPFSIDSISQLKLPAANGSLVPFSAVAEIDEGQVISAIRRIDGKREVTVTAETRGEVVTPRINSDIQGLFRDDFAARFPDVELDVGGEFAEIADTLTEIARVFIIGVFLIYLILATQFRSYTQPLLILLTVPFAFVGVILYLILSGAPLSTTVIYAGVALAGIAVNDTIVLVTFVNETRAEGAPIRQAIIEAASTRLRPILLTSLTTIAGLLPTALGVGGRSVIWGPMASTIIFGLIFSTVTALIIVPSLYGIFYDKSNREQRRQKRRERRESKKG